MSKIWHCKIGEVAELSQNGQDFPMRIAVRDAYVKITGEEPKFCFSGWGGELDEIERAVVEQRDPKPQPKMVPQAEVDALVAAERALFAQKATDLIRVCPLENFPLYRADSDLIAAKILALADPNALAEHDAALLKVSENRLIEASAELMKLEAENAGLRESLKWALDWVDTSSCDAIEYEGLTKARALLGEAAGPEGRK